MTRGRSGSAASFSSNSGDNSHHLNDQLNLAMREKEELQKAMENLKLQFSQSLQESSDRYRHLNAEKNMII